jgi:PAS domain-containing protein
MKTSNKLNTGAFAAAVTNGPASLEAVVVTNVDRRFVAANPIALHLFGVSEINITHD